jgi:ferredoxin--NADP+ reductase
MTTLEKHEQLEASYDAVVVGAGLAGLITGCLLAKAGENVLIIERQDKTGGNASYIADGEWRWDLGLQFFGDGHEGGPIRRIMRLCGAEPPEMQPLDDPFDEVVIGDDSYQYYRNRSRFFNVLRARFPQSTKGIDRYEKLLEEGERFEASGRGKSGAPMAVRLLRNPTYARYSQRPLREFLEAHIDDERLRAVLTAQNMNYMDDPAETAAGIHISMQNHVFRSGLWYPSGGIHALARSLEEAFLRQDGTIAYGATVDKFDIRNGIARGVRARFIGESEPFSISSHIVVSNADIVRTIHEYAGAEQFDASLSERITRTSVSFPVACLNLGLDIPPEEAPFGSQNQWHYSGVNMAQYYETLSRGTWPSQLLALLSSATGKGNPTTFAPDGCSTLSILTPAPRSFATWGIDAKMDDSPEAIRESIRANADGDYAEACARVRKRLLAIAEAHFPGVSEQIIAERLVTPPEYAAMSASTAGSMFGLTGRPEYFLHNRPGVRTDVVGLYLCGPSIRPGYSPLGAFISGVVAADAIANKGFREVLSG